MGVARSQEEQWKSLAQDVACLSPCPVSRSVAVGAFAAGGMVHWTGVRIILDRMNWRTFFLPMRPNGWGPSIVRHLPRRRLCNVYIYRRSVRRLGALTDSRVPDDAVRGPGGRSRATESSPGASSSGTKF